MKKNEQIKFHHQKRRMKSDSQRLDDKDNMVEYNRVRKETKEKNIKDQKAKGFVTDNIWALTMGTTI